VGRGGAHAKTGRNVKKYRKKDTRDPEQGIPISFRGRGGCGGCAKFLRGRWMGCQQEQKIRTDEVLKSIDGSLGPRMGKGTPEKSEEKCPKKSQPDFVDAKVNPART